MSRSRHVVVYDATNKHGRPPYTIECQRCGETVHPSVPISVTVFVAMARAFGREHKHCRLAR